MKPLATQKRDRTKVRNMIRDTKGRRVDDKTCRPQPQRQLSSSSLSTYQAQPISKHYAVSNQLLAAFDAFCDKLLYRAAYAFGIQFLEVALLEIPKHGYFYAERHEAERIANSQNSLRVSKQLLMILQEFADDAKASDYQSVRKLQLLAQEQASEQARRQENYEKDRLKVEKELAESQSTLCGDMFEYVELICPIDTTIDTSLPLDTSTQSNLTQTSNFEPEQSAASIQSTDSHHRDELERAIFVSGVEHHPTSSSGGGSHRRKRSLNAIDMASLNACYYEDFFELVRRGRLRVSQLRTYQGRLEGSINGCTVIAPLLCLHHFLEEANMGLSDMAVEEVIDKETPAILPQVRGELGLTKDALIIPSDVHDFLIKRQLLTTEQFVTVCGGNILDDAHLGEFVKHLIQPSKDGRKIAATFFFHEHVVAILKIQLSPSEVWFDLIDSLPHQETIRKHCTEDFVPNAARIRSMNVEAFTASLRWYACSRFTDDNMQYMDMYDWDEAYSDFDPRVFQAFIWTELK